ncbi:MAG: TM2 domain-containing protein [Rikenellaceae bacterium]
MYCKHCGKEINDNAVICVHCGCASATQPVNQNTTTDNRGLTTLLLCIFLGGLGIHRFYVGKTGTGILMLFTLGCCGILTLIDLIMIVMGEFTDADGNKLKI